MPVLERNESVARAARGAVLVAEAGPEQAVLRPFRLRHVAAQDRCQRVVEVQRELRVLHRQDAVVHRAFHRARARGAEHQAAALAQADVGIDLGPELVGGRIVGGRSGGHQRQAKQPRRPAGPGSRRRRTARNRAPRHASGWAASVRERPAAAGRLPCSAGMAAPGRARQVEHDGREQRSHGSLRWRLQAAAVRAGLLVWRWAQPARRARPTAWPTRLGRDSEVTLHFRTYYFDRLNPKPPDNAAWAIGGWVGYRTRLDRRCCCASASSATPRSRCGRRRTSPAPCCSRRSRTAIR